MLTVSIYKQYGHCQYVGMASKKTDRYHHGALREALLAEAMKILDAEGVDAVTIRAVAREVGVSHTAPANHFASRSALLTALATAAFRQVDAAVAQRLRSTRAQRRDRIRVFADELLAFGLKHPQRYRLMWRRDLLEEDAELQAAMDGLYDQLIAELQAQAGKPKLSAHTLAVALWSMTHGYVLMRLDGNFEERRDELTGAPRFQAMVELVLAGA